MYEWQRIDEENGLCELWLTHDSLDWIKAQNWKNKVVFMFGAGMGDAWLAKRCKKLYVVERKEEWLIKAADICTKAGVDNVQYFYRPCNDSSGMEEMYCEIPKDIVPDVIISDDAYRTEVVRMAIDFFKKEMGGILICDNWWQDMVWKSPIAVEWVEPFDKLIFPQENHTDHQGECWKTAIIFIK